MKFKRILSAVLVVSFLAGCSKVDKKSSLPVSPDPVETWVGVVMEAAYPEQKNGMIGKVVLSPAWLVSSPEKLTSMAKYANSRLSPHPYKKGVIMRVHFHVRKNASYSRPEYGDLCRVKCVTGEDGKKWLKSVDEERRIDTTDREWDR